MTKQEFLDPALAKILNTFVMVIIIFVLMGINFSCGSDGAEICLANNPIYRYLFWYPVGFILAWPAGLTFYIFGDNATILAIILNFAYLYLLACIIHWLFSRRKGSKVV